MNTATIRNVWQSERLTYRSIEQDDHDWMFSAIDSDPVNTALATPQLLAPPRRKKPEEWLEMWRTPSMLVSAVVCLKQPQQQEKQLPTIKGLEEKPKPKPKPEERIGMVTLMNGGFGTSPHSRAASFGISISAAYQGMGYGTEVTNWALDWAFRNANMHSVNLSSISYSTCLTFD